MPNQIKNESRTSTKTVHTFFFVEDVKTKEKNENRIVEVFDAPVALRNNRKFVDMLNATRQKIYDGQPYSNSFVLRSEITCDDDSLVYESTIKFTGEEPLYVPMTGKEAKATLKTLRNRIWGTPLGDAINNASSENIAANN